MLMYLSPFRKELLIYRFSIVKVSKLTLRRFVTVVMLILLILGLFWCHTAHV